jgi:16S rRNA pseudouridine516 synthase
MRLDELATRVTNLKKKEIVNLAKRRKILIDGVPEFSLKRNVDTGVQKIMVDGKLITDFAHHYFLMNKQKGRVSANSDAEYLTVMDDLTRVDFNENLYSVGRLDFNTTGLLLITDNGPLGFHMLEPRHHVSKKYLVTTKEALEEADVEKFRKGIVIDGTVQTAPANLEIIDAHHAIVEISEGKYHQVKKMFLSVGKKVEKLKRLSFGPLVLDENLAEGDYRKLTKEEIKSLLPYFD